MVAGLTLYPHTWGAMVPANSAEGIIACSPAAAVPFPHGRRDRVVTGWRRCPQGRKVLRVCWRSRGCLPKSRMVRHSRGLHKPRSVSTSTVNVGGTAGATWRSKACSGGTHAPRCVAGWRCQAMGIALPRYRTLTTMAAGRSWWAVASTAQGQGLARPPGQHPAQQGHKTGWHHHLGRTGGRFVGAITEPLAQRLPHRMPGPHACQGADEGVLTGPVEPGPGADPFLQSHRRQWVLGQLAGAQGKHRAPATPRMVLRGAGQTGTPNARRSRWMPPPWATDLWSWRSVCSTGAAPSRWPGSSCRRQRAGPGKPSGYACSSTCRLPSPRP